MCEVKDKEPTKKKLHIEFGQGCALGRRYNVFSGERYDSPYIWENDEEMAERYRRAEEIEWEEKMKKKYGQVNTNNK